MEFRKRNEYGAIDEKHIVEFEKDNGVTLPNDYKEFLKEYNGGEPVNKILPKPNTTIQYVYGMVEEPSWASLFKAIDTFQNRIPSWYVPIANDDGGNLIIMNLYEESRGVIAFWDHENECEGDADQYFENLTLVANSFTEFVNSLQK